MWRVFYSVSPRTPEGGQAGKGDKPHPYHIFCSHSAHTQLSLATSKRGNVASLLFGKPPNPRRGTSWKKVTNLTPITYYVLAGHIPSCCWLPQRGGMWGRENDYKVVNQRQLFLKILIHTDNFLTFVRFRKL